MSLEKRGNIYHISAMGQRRKEDPERMSALVVINRKSGTVRTRGADTVEKLVMQKLAPYFCSLEVKLLDGDVLPAVRQALEEKTHQIIIAGGGDGTIASVASLLVDGDVVLGALPLGTMNLIVQALGFSPVLEEALEQFSAAQLALIDVGMANDRIFLHQVSFGLQPRMAKLRDRIGYTSRAGKMLGSVRAFTLLVLRPKMVRVDIDLDGTVMRVKAPLVAVTNNPVGSDKNWSIQHRLDGGLLGYYVLSDFKLSGLFRIAWDYVGNRLHDNDAVDNRTAQSVVVKRRPRFLAGRRPDGKKRKGLLSSLDGEVTVLDNPVKISIRPKSLRVLARHDLNAP